jgi:pantetheine-phosphate adenylyltransferase
VKKEAIYAGTFDPLTMGHLDVLERACRIFDRVVVAVDDSFAKETMFSLKERVVLAKEVSAGMEGVEVDSFSGLLMDYAAQKKIDVILRGLRAFSDFEFEFQMALTNRKLAPDIETVFMMPKDEYSYLSSSMVREVGSLGGDISNFVPPAVGRALAQKFAP